MADRGMGEETDHSRRRVPIRRRVFYAILLTTLTVLAIATVTGMVFMLRTRDRAEDILSAELRRSLSSEVEQKAKGMDSMFTAHEKLIETVRDYTEEMYRDRDELAASGKFIDSPRDSIGKDEYALTAAYASDDMKPEDYMDELHFYSHLEPILEPVAKENTSEITTIYLGSRSGLLISYDRWSYLSVVPEPDVLVYDFTKSSWYKKGMKSDGVFFTDLYVDAMGRGLTITIASPYKDLQGNVQGVIAADFDITGLYKNMISMDLGDDSRSFAIDSDNKVISMDSEEEQDVHDYLDLAEADVKTITSGGTGIMEKRDAFYAYAPVRTTGWTLCAMVPRSVLMESVSDIERSFRLALLFLALTAAVLVAAGLYLSRRVTGNITDPIEHLAEDMKILAEGDLDHRAVIQNNDEIGDLTRGLNDMVDRLKAAMEDLVSARKRAEELRELAYRDSLTGVRNKAAYDACLKDVDAALAAGDENFGMVMIDLNYLKVINDTYGHGKGNLALKKICSIICGVYSHSPVFRIGGDEYAVILQKGAYEEHQKLEDEFLRIIEKNSTDNSLEPWERISASIGTALYDRELDGCAEDVFIRADTIMYKHKSAMKAVRE